MTRNNQFRANLNKSSIFISDSRKTGSATCLREFREFHNLKLKFAKMPLLISLHNILTLEDLLQDNSLQLKPNLPLCYMNVNVIDSYDAKR